MKEKIDLIFSNLKNECITEKQAHQQVLDLFAVSGSLTPHRCPVCNGNGLVPNGFYGHRSTTSIDPETCRSCDGTGIVWG